MQKQAVFKIKGMSRDLSESAFNSQHAYENMNMRMNGNNRKYFIKPCK